MSERKEKFTPGPWRVHLDKRNGTVCAIIEDKSGDCVARTVYRFHRGERNANGHLITAAPEMYALLDKCESCIRHLLYETVDDPVFDEAENTIREIQELLKKARGDE